MNVNVTLTIKGKLTTSTDRIDTPKLILLSFYLSTLLNRN